MVTNGSPMPARSLEQTHSGKPRFRGCVSIREFEPMCKLGEGTFGEVYKARHKRSGNIVALKKILLHNEKDGFPITALREIKLLKLLSHRNVLQLQEMAVERPRGEGRKKCSMYMVTPYMEHDLTGLLENQNVTLSEPVIKCYMRQLLEGMNYLHQNKILHRDMKAANLLINNQGILQIADFGLARPYDEPPPQRGKGGGEAVREYTTLVVTRWYRPPELLLHLRKYTTAIDMWGVGCVFGEMFKKRPILAGNTDVAQTQLIFNLVGSPNDESMPGWSELPNSDLVKGFAPKKSSIATVFAEQSPLAISLLSEFLKLDWRKRITAIDALDHPYFTTPPLPASLKDVPKFEDSHEFDRRRVRGGAGAGARKEAPPAPTGGSVGMGPAGNVSSRSGSDTRPMGSRVPAMPGAGSRIPQPGYGGAGGGQRGHSSRVPDGGRGGPAWRQDGPGGGAGAWRGGDGRSRDRVPPHKDSYVPAYNGASDRSRGDWHGRDRDRSRRRSRSPDPR